MALFADLQRLEDQTQTVITAAANWALDMQNTLTGIHNNTNQVFFWSMFVGAGVATAVMLWTLNRLRDELQELNRHQVIYRDMWIEERNQMHRQMQYDEDRKDDTISDMQQQWGTVEKIKRVIMEKGLQQQGDLVKVLLGEAAAKQTKYPKPGDPNYADFQRALIDVSQMRHAAMQGLGGQRQLSLAAD